MNAHATGGFDVELEPQTRADSKADGTSIGRALMHKRFHGDLAAESKGEMLTATTAIRGSAAYVAVELVDGTLHGRRGTFALQHAGRMARGEQQLEIRVVTDSGTGGLAGL
jgi:Protein of unknown function (DUF3224)